LGQIGEQSPRDTDSGETEQSWIHKAAEQKLKKSGYDGTRKGKQKNIGKERPRNQGLSKNFNPDKARENGEGQDVQGKHKGEIGNAEPYKGQRFRDEVFYRRQEQTKRPQQRGGFSNAGFIERGYKRFCHYRAFPLSSLIGLRYRFAAFSSRHRFC
jgi:hypothetical protein